MWALALVVLSYGVLRRGSPGCGKATSLPVGRPTEQEIQLPSGPRVFHVTLPERYSPSEPYPVVFGFHGWGLSGADLLQYDGAVAAAKDGRVIAVHPDGAQDVPQGRSAWRAWNAVGSSMASGASNATCSGVVRSQDYACYTSCGAECSRCSWASCEDDAAFIDALLDRLEADFCVDRTQVRGHGESNGGMLVWQLLQSPVAARFATLVSVIGSPARGAQRPPAAPVRFLGLWGTADRTIPAGDGVALSSDGFYYETAENATAKVAAAYGCASPAPWPAPAGVSCERWTCPPPAEVVHCTFNGHHDWPEQANPLIYGFYEGRASAPLLRRSKLHSLIKALL